VPREGGRIPAPETRLQADSATAPVPGKEGFAACDAVLGYPAAEASLEWESGLLEDRPRRRVPGEDRGLHRHETAAPKGVDGEGAGCAIRRLRGVKCWGGSAGYRGGGEAFLELDRG
jgi:hypothetical protein